MSTRRPTVRTRKRRALFEDKFYEPFVDASTKQRILDSSARSKALFTIKVPGVARPMPVRQEALYLGLVLVLAAVFLLLRLLGA